VFILTTPYCIDQHRPAVTPHPSPRPTLQPQCTSAHTDVQTVLHTASHSEILPNKIKGRVAGLATFLGWGGNLLVAFSFMPLLSSLGFGATFTIYAALSVLGALFVFWRMVETKQKSLRQVGSPAPADNCHGLPLCVLPSRATITCLR
jgi:hypothetical protein